MCQGTEIEIDLGKTRLEQVRVEGSPVKVQKAWEFVDLDTGTESGEVDGIDGLLHQG